MLYCGNGEIIEAMPGEDAGVRTYPLQKLIAESQKVVVLRRVGLTPSQGMAVVERARYYIGRKYDMLGAVGSVTYQIVRFGICPVPSSEACDAISQAAGAVRWRES